MRYKKYHVYLTEKEKEYLKQIVKKGSGGNGLHFGRTFCNSLELLVLTILREWGC